MSQVELLQLTDSEYDCEERGCVHRYNDSESLFQLHRDFKAAPLRWIYDAVGQ